MSKIKKVFFCKNCGVESPKWLGKCNSCDQWNTFVEEIIQKETSNFNKSPILKDKKKNIPLLLDQITSSTQNRIVTIDKEFNRVTGGGIVLGSIILMGGEPGIGKSTLLLQIALTLTNIKVLYVSGEESIEQIKMRAERLNVNNPNFLVLSETNTQQIFEHVQTYEPNLLVIDSIQTVFTNNIMSSSGSLSQVRECAGDFQRLAKETNIPVILIGHINKDGDIAGPKILEHIVDTVLQFEGDNNYTFRLLRTIKNRFGSSQELGIYEMKGNGLIPIVNPSQILLSQREESLSGISIASIVEGLRPLMIETQALVSSAVYGNPQRISTGYDSKRLNMLLAVLEKRAGFALGSKDVFLNIAGGLKVVDPSIDLSVIVAIMSSYQDVEINLLYAFAAEVGLSGEIRSIPRIDQRILEADKLGFKKIFISKFNNKYNNPNLQIEVVEVGKVMELFNQIF